MEALLSNEVKKTFFEDFSGRFPRENITMLKLLIHVYFHTDFFACKCPILSKNSELSTGISSHIW